MQHSRFDSTHNNARLRPAYFAMAKGGPKKRNGVGGGSKTTQSKKKKKTDNRRSAPGSKSYKVEKLVEFRVIEIDAPLRVADSVTGARTVKKKVKEFLVRWAGYDAKYDSYVREEFVSPVCIAAFKGGTSLTQKPSEMLATVPEAKHPSSPGYEAAARFAAWSRGVAATHGGKSVPSKRKRPSPPWGGDSEGSRDDMGKASYADGATRGAGGTCNVSSSSSSSGTGGASGVGDGASGSGHAASTGESGGGCEATPWEEGSENVTDSLRITDEEETLMRETAEEGEDEDSTGASGGSTKVRIIKFQKKWEAQALEYVRSVDKIIALGKKEAQDNSSSSSSSGRGCTLSASNAVYIKVFKSKAQQRDFPHDKVLAMPMHNAGINSPVTVNLDSWSCNTCEGGRKMYTDQRSARLESILRHLMSTSHQNQLRLDVREVRSLTHMCNFFSLYIPTPCYIFLRRVCSHPCSLNIHTHIGIHRRVIYLYSIFVFQSTHPLSPLPCFVTDYLCS